MIMELTADEQGRYAVAAAGHGLTPRQLDGLARYITEESRNADSRQDMALTLVYVAALLHALGEADTAGFNDAVREWSPPILGVEWPEFLLQCATPDGPDPAAAARFGDACRELGVVLYVAEEA